MKKILQFLMRLFGRKFDGLMYEEPDALYAEKVNVTEWENDGSYQCIACGWVYSPQEHKSVPFSRLSDDYVCPDCGVSIDLFEPVSSDTSGEYGIGGFNSDNRAKTGSAEENADSIMSFSLNDDTEDTANMLRMLEKSRISSQILEYRGGLHEPFYEQLSARLVDLHGPLSEVDFLSGPPICQMIFVYQDGERIVSEKPDLQVSIHSMTFGYIGQGSRYLHHFFLGAGIDLSVDQISGIRAGDSLQIAKNHAKLVKEKDKVNESNLSDVTFSYEDKKVSYGMLATYRYYKAPSKEKAMRFLDKQNITAQSYFLVVQTPDGTYAKDRMGLFEP